MAKGKKTGGRRPGSLNKRTQEMKAASERALATAIATMGPNVFEGDAHALLISVYKNTELPIQLRLDAAKNAVRFEKPVLSTVDSTIDDKRSFVARMPQPETTPEQWLQQYGTLKDRDASTN